MNQWLASVAMIFILAVGGALSGSALAAPDLYLQLKQALIQEDSESVRAFAPGPLHLVGDACGPIGALPPGSGEVDVAAVCRALPKDSTLTFLPWIGLTAKEAMAGLHAVSRLHPAAQHAEKSWPSSPVPRPAE